MKLTTEANVTILTKEKKEASGEYGESFKMAIMQGSEVGTFPCTKEAFLSVDDGNLMKPHAVQFMSSEYQGKTSVRITGVVGLVKQ